MTPHVSVVIPTRNRRASLERALASVDAQRFRDFEVVVVDDGSDDGTTSWVRSQHPGITLLETGGPLGAAAARNLGVQHSRGGIVAFLDDDDVWHPSVLAVQVAQLDANPECDLCTTGHVEVDRQGRVFQPDLRPLNRYSDSMIHFLAECPIHTLSVVACRRTVFERLGPFDSTLAVVHDLDWYLRVIADGGKIAHHSPALVERSVPGGLVTQHRRWFREEQAVHNRFFDAHAIERREKRLVRALRALFFAKVAFANGDFAFGLVRLAGAVLASPVDALRIATRRLSRRSLRDTPETWDRQAWEVR